MEADEFNFTKQRLLIVRAVEPRLLVAAQVLREFKPSEPDLAFHTGMGIERDSDFAIFPRNPIEIRNRAFTFNRCPSSPVALAIVPRQLHAGDPNGEESRSVRRIPFRKSPQTPTF